MKKSISIPFALLAGGAAVWIGLGAGTSELNAGEDHHLIFVDVPPTLPCDQTYHVPLGQLVTYALQFSPSNPNDTVGFRGPGVELPDAVMNPPTPVLGDGPGEPAYSEFSWTPTEYGTFTARYIAALVGFHIRARCDHEFVVREPVGDHCSYTQGGWGAPPHGGNPASILAANFAAVYPNGVEVGIPGGEGHSMRFSSAQAVQDYLPAGGPPKALTADSVDPTGNAGAGVFGGQVLALQINVDFSAAGVIQLKSGPLGNVVLCGLNAWSGETVSDLLHAANQALGGGPLPYGMSSVSELNDLVTNLNEAFGGCEASKWATENLCQ